MHIYDQCNFWAPILPSTCLVISDLLSVSCATIARKNLIGWCKQRDFFSRRLGARFMSISKPFYQHSGTIYRRPKSYLVVTIWHSDGKLRPGMAPICDDSLCFSTPTAGYVVACTWTGSGHTWQLTGPTVLLKLCWHPELWSSFINKHSLLMQTEAVAHCQIQRQTSTCCNAELSLSNHRYTATWTLDGKISGKIWGDHLGSIIYTWKMWDLCCS